VREVDQTLAATRIVLRPIASPLPLAFFAFATGSFVLGTEQLGFVGTDQVRPINLLLLVFLAPLQVLAAIVSFPSRESLAAAGLALIGLTWPASSTASRAASATSSLRWGPTAVSRSCSKRPNADRCSRWAARGSRRRRSTRGYGTRWRQW